MINAKGDLFAAAVSFGGLSILKLLSSVVLTRLLYPEAYGVVTMVSSIAFVMEMLSDVGVLGLMVRHERADEPGFINTMWTIRLVRGTINAAILFAVSPLLAMLYDTPALRQSLQIFSIWFLLYALESMSFTLAVRRRNSRIVNYCELGCAAVSTTFVIVFSYFSRDHLGMIYGMLVNRGLMSAISYLFYRRETARLQLDREVVAASMGFAKYTVPSGLVTIVLSQFDKFIFLKLFNIQLLGLYGLAGNISGPIDSLVTRISRSVLYPRCAENFRREPSTVRDKYYSENVKLWMFILSMPAALAGASGFLVHVLFDARYAHAAVILQAFALRGMIGAMAGPAENVLVATGTPRPVLYGNMLRVAWLIPGSLLGYHFWGFPGFLYIATLETLPALLFYLWLQHKRQLLIAKYEAMKLAFMGAVFLAALGVGSQLAVVVPPIHAKGGF